MDELLLRSHELRDDPAVHYNCAQGVFIPFAEKKGLTKQQAFDIAQNFGGGMRAGMTCGAITGGLMALGLYGVGEPKDAVAFIQKISSLHGGRTQCRDLLAAEVTSKEQKKPHCDGMFYESVEAVEEMLWERGIEI